MPADNYMIRSDYTHRPKIQTWDDMPYRDQFQREVYELAATRVQPGDCVIDVGCGSGFKLCAMFASDMHTTVGVELSQFVPLLSVRYPDRCWLRFDPRRHPSGSYAMLICADVIEHVADPDAFLDYLDAIHWAQAVISTPARRPSHTGPPKNRHHHREWSMDEFRSYIASRKPDWEIVRHEIANPPINSCQVIQVDRRSA